MLPGMREADRADKAASGPVPAPAGSGRRGRLAFWATLAAIIVAGAAVVTVFAVIRAGSGPQPARPTGIPASVSDAQINLMGLSPVPVRPAPGFTLTDQDGRTLSLSSLHGKVVVLEFMDPHCTDICPIVSQEYVDAYRDLGALADKVVFAAVNVNQYHAAVADMMAYSREQRLVNIPDWHFLTGPVPDLHKVWDGYSVAVQAPSPNADIVHTSVVYFIDPAGRERFIAAPMADHTSSGTSYLPAGQITAWGQAIAQVARILAR
jgi:protein SCO1/2